MVQWLGLCAFTAEGVGSIPGQGTKIPQAVQWDQKKERKFWVLFESKVGHIPRSKEGTLTIVTRH